eukprot:CAMPEP_0172814286 /NCGR_PEP_ID=MMETSP1075-20121228/11153_1 /TAXON_ID=2916 /ORGANISM="Ceratium fusus, Strain PA161109" /LENGTH=404 /DNA_ID=CAMNT_0013654075 /DNA_START=62 /DNA_END=1276 /DNA_ORIENTATION=-
MPAETSTYLMPSAFRDDDTCSEINMGEVDGGLSAVSRVVFGHVGQRSSVKKFGLAMLVFATAGTACAFVSGSLPSNSASPESAGALIFFGEKHKKKDDNDRGTCGKPFSKCGGTDFTGKACCQRGCACIKNSQYYSMCAAPAGLDECDVGEARKMAKKLDNKARPLRKKANIKAAIYKKKQAMADGLQKEFVKARAAAMKALKKAQAAQAELDRQNTTLQAATKRMHFMGWQKDQALMWWGTVDNENNKGCGDWNGDCTASKCCQHGCGCNVKNPFYSQCGPPQGETSCSVPIARNSAKKHAIQATGDKDKFTAKDAKKAVNDQIAKVQSHKEALEKLVKLHDAAHKEYQKLHGIRAEAENKRDHSKMVAEKAKANANKAKQKIKLAQEAADSWSNSMREPVSV